MVAVLGAADTAMPDAPLLPEAQPLGSAPLLQPQLPQLPQRRGRGLLPVGAVFRCTQKLRLALLAAPPELLDGLRDVLDAPPGEPRRHLQRKLLAPMQAAQGRAYLAAIAGDQQRQAAHRSQCGWLGSAFLRASCSPTGGTQFGIADFVLLVLLYLGVGVPNVPSIACPGRRDGRILAPATAFPTFMGCSVANKYRLHSQVGCKFAEIAESMPGNVIVQREVMDSPATAAHQRGGPAGSSSGAPSDGFRMDFRILGLGDGCTPLLVDVSVPCPTCASYVGNAALVSNYAARATHDAKVKKYQRFVSGTDRFLPFAVEALGGCTETLPDGRGVVETLAGWALQKARVDTGLREETSAEAKRRVLRRRSLILEHWRTQLSAALARGRVLVVGDLMRACGLGAGTRRQPRGGDEDEAAGAPGTGVECDMWALVLPSALRRAAGFRGGRQSGVGV